MYHIICKGMEMVDLVWRLVLVAGIRQGVRVRLSIYDASLPLLGEHDRNRTEAMRSSPLASILSQHYGIALRPWVCPLFSKVQRLEVAYVSQTGVFVSNRL
ncbi:hypothetical protein K439DRAFT_172514 [Ramaria rubella]|nr:hypothetical protein K439DRAFT_172514 [Ramaria rubella]